MATVIDTLVIELGLDPKKFTAGQRAAVKSAQQTTAQMKKSADEIEKAGQKAADFYRKLRNEALAFFAAVAGAAGLTQFVTKLTTADDALGITAKNLNMNVKSLSAWSNAVERAGGTVEDAVSAFQHYSDQLNTFDVKGQNAIEADLQELQQVGGVVIDRMSTKEEQMKAIGENLKNLAQSGQHDKANFIGRNLGFSPGFVNFLQQGGDAIDAALKRSRELGVTTEEDAAKARDLANAWKELVQAFTDAGRAIVREVTPYIKDMLASLVEFIKLNKGEIAQGFKDFLKFLQDNWPKVKDGFAEFVEYVRENYPAVRDAFSKISEAVKHATEAVGGLGNMVKILVGLWVGGKLLSIIAALAAASPALVALATAAGALLAGYAINELTGGPGPEGESSNPLYDPQKMADSETRQAESNKLIAQLRNKDTQQKYRDSVSSLRARGFGDAEAHGMAANILAESSFNSSIISPDGGAQGLMQWRGSRLASLKSFASKKGKDWRDKDVQYDFMAYERNEDRGMALSHTTLNQPGVTADQAGSFFSRHAERHGDTNKDWARGAAAEYGQRNLNTPAFAGASGLAGQPLRGQSPGQGSTSNNTVNIGEVNVQTQATDADGIAGDMNDALNRHITTQQFQYGTR